MDEEKNVKEYTPNYLKYKTYFKERYDRLKSEGKCVLCKNEINELNPTTNEKYSTCVFCRKKIANSKLEDLNKVS
jgi:hypothetical protein